MEDCTYFLCQIKRKPTLVNRLCLSDPRGLRSKVFERTEKEVTSTKFDKTQRRVTTLLKLIS